LAQAIYDDTDFSFSLEKIPVPDFVQRFKAKHEVIFMQFEAQNPTA
jgi:hypothetical protein